MNESCDYISPATLASRLSDASALFLDFDGTLVELAPTPDAVKVSAHLPALLQRLAQQLDGALSIVTGRPVAQVDTYFAPLQFTCAGTHGAERRVSGHPLVQMPVPSLDHVDAIAVELAAHDTRLILERKHGALAVHYRLAPELETLCLTTMSEAVCNLPGIALLHGKMVVEVKAAGLDKGSAIRDLMTSSPFAGRQPVFIGDDVTDEAGFMVVRELNGIAVKVGLGMTLAPYRLSGPAAVHQLLNQLFI
jgi:trehalose 6-phosphate phosphatase